MEKAHFNFEGYVDYDIFRLFRHDMMNRKMTIFLYLYPIICLPFSLFVLIGRIYSLFIIFFLAGILPFGIKWLSNRRIFKTLWALFPGIFMNEDDRIIDKVYSVAFYDDFFAVIRQDGKRIEIAYSHLDRIVERQQYMAVFMKEGLYFPFSIPEENRLSKNELLNFIKKKKHNVWFKHIKQN